MRLERNIRKVLDRADEIDINEGRVAYYRYREVCARVANQYGYPLEKVIACFAALSPNLDYRGNLRSLLSVIDGHASGRPASSITTAGYNHCRDRAYSYLSDVSFLDTVKGPKIRSFYHNILNPLDASYVTIDGHAVNITKGKVMPLKSVAAKSFNYELIATAYKAVAHRTGLVPNQLQAITWFTWKRINNIVYTPPQLGLFEDRTQDLWRTVLMLDDLKPYGY